MMIPVVRLVSVVLVSIFALFCWNISHPVLAALLVVLVLSVVAGGLFGELHRPR